MRDKVNSVVEMTKTINYVPTINLNPFHKNTENICVEIKYTAIY